MELYRSIDVWRRLPDSLARYRCFEVLPAKGYCVQSADFYRPGQPAEVRVRELEAQYLELLAEEAPERRSKPYPTLELAIEAHDREFGQR
jgi:hypothetical protein